MQAILQDRSILKVGVGPLEDAKYLYQDFYGGNVENHTRATLDLRYLSDMANCFEGTAGLGKMAATYLGVALDKRLHIRCSNWNALSLNVEQIDYAAKDALVAIELFKYFAEKIEPSGFFSNSSTCLRNVIQKCTPHFDKKYVVSKNKKYDDWVKLS